MKYWLFKSEPSVFGIDHLSKSPRKTASWDGVRNYQARNFMRDEMKAGDLGFFYHSSCDVPGIVGTVRIVREAHPDVTALQKGHPHFDPDSKPDTPRWMMVDVRLEKRFKHAITLDELRKHANTELKDLLILRKGNRLSITPVTHTQWQFILSLLDE
jgi:predicted RNA-binding protein with PUA-like domain